MAVSDNFYLEVIEDIRHVFTELGKTYQIRGVATRSPINGTTTETAERTVNGIVADSTFMSGMLPDKFPTNKKYLVLDYQSDPKTNEEVLIDGAWLPCMKFEEVKPADIVVAYMMDITK